jgi:AraC-like DNA-binding protein
MESQETIAADASLVAPTGGQATSGTQACSTQDSGTSQNNRATELPPWQKISGLTPDAEKKLSRSERRHALRKLFKEYEKRIREALSEESAADAENDPRERTYLWSPLESICFELGIARRKLSALTRELTGMAAHEVIDRIRAEKVAEQLKASLRDQACKKYDAMFAVTVKYYPEHCTPKKYDAYDLKHRISQKRLDEEAALLRAAIENGPIIKPTAGWASVAADKLGEIWQARRERVELAWFGNFAGACRNEWARSLGFSSYARLYRACLLCHSVAPQELEHRATCELLDEFHAASADWCEAIRMDVNSIR